MFTANRLSIGKLTFNDSQVIEIIKLEEGGEMFCNYFYAPLVWHVNVSTIVENKGDIELFIT